MKEHASWFFALVCIVFSIAFWLIPSPRLQHHHDNCKAKDGYFLVAANGSVCIAKSAVIE